MKEAQELLELVKKINYFITRPENKKLIEHLIFVSLTSEKSTALKRLKIVYQKNEQEIILPCYLNCEYEQFIIPLPNFKFDNKTIFVLGLFIYQNPKTNEWCFYTSCKKNIKSPLARNTNEIIKIVLKKLGYGLIKRKQARKITGKKLKPKKTTPTQPPPAIPRPLRESWV